jgi:hypothetical protein
MQLSRVVVALIVAPLVGALAYVALGAVQYSGFAYQLAGSDIVTTFVGMAVVGVAFEVFFLLPAAVVLRHRERFVLNVAAVGIVAWFGLMAGGLALIGQNALSIAITSAQLLALGIPLVLAFVVLARKGLHG